jgi:hypothetical protein
VRAGDKNGPPSCRKKDDQIISLHGGFNGRNTELNVNRRPVAEELIPRDHLSHLQNRLCLFLPATYSTRLCGSECASLLFAFTRH